MKYFEISPDPPLDRYIQCFTVAEGKGCPPEYILPDGIVELVFHFGDPMMTIGVGPNPKVSLSHRCRSL